MNDCKIKVSVLAPTVRVKARMSISYCIHRGAEWEDRECNRDLVGWLWPGMSLGSLPSIWLAGPGLGGLKRGTQPRESHTKPNELRVREMNCSVAQNLGLVEQNKKESVAVQGPGTPAIKPKHLLGLRVNLATSAVVPRKWGWGIG